MTFIGNLNALSVCIADKAKELNMTPDETLAALYLICDVKKVGFARYMHSKYAKAEADEKSKDVKP